MNKIVRFIISIIMLGMGAIFGYVVALPGGFIDCFLGILVFLAVVLVSSTVMFGGDDAHQEEKAE